MTDMNFETARFNMLEQQIRPWEVLDQSSLDIIEEIPRENFVATPYKAMAFADIELPLGKGEFMLSPKLEAKILQAVQIQSNDKILEIGTGSGYLTALMATQGQQVVSLDIQAEFSNLSQTRLAALSIDNVRIETIDAAQDYPGDEKFDVIVLTGSVPLLPESYKQKLTTGGRLFVVTGQDPVMEARLITRISDDQWADVALFETQLAALDNAQQPDPFSF